MMEPINDRKKPSAMDRAIAFVSEIFTPTLPVITAAGILKALILLLASLGILKEDSSTYYIFSFVSNAGFYFLPFLLAYSAAKRCGGNPYLAMFLTAILFHPDFTSLVENGGSLTFLALPVTMKSYSSTVIPAFLIGWGSSFVEKHLRKWLPDIISFFAVPLLTTLIVAPLTLLVLGPVGLIIGDALSNSLIFIHDKIGWPAVVLLAGLTPLLVTAGFGLAFLPPALASIETLGYDAFSRPAFLTANIAMATAALAISIKSKHRETKSLALQSSVVAYMGITEPSIYGLLLPLKRPFIASIIGSSIGGVVSGLAGIRSVAYASPSIITLPIFLGDTFPFTLLAVAVTIAVTFVLTWTLGFEDKILHGEEKQQNTE